MDLIERDDLIAELRGFQRSAAAGNGCLVWLGGEAGAGKSSVLRSLANGSPNRVIWGACDALSTPRPLGPLYDLAADGATRVADALAHGASRQELFAELLADLATPSLVLIEDVHWADDATLDLFRFIGRRVHRGCSLVVLTYRTDEVDAHRGLRAVMGDLTTAIGCRRESVHPLSLDGVCRLAVGQPVDAVRLHAVSGGNPFFVTEVLASPGWSVPPTVADAVLARIERLGDAGRAAADAASIEPARMERWLAAKLMDDPGGLIDAGAAGVLDVGFEWIAFRHELARRAVEEHLEPGRRSELHAGALKALEGHDADPARLAHHAEAAGDHERLLRWAPDAARRAEAAGAPREAATQYERALRCVAAGDVVRRIELLEPYAGLLSVLDRPEASIDAHNAIVELRERLGDRTEVAVAQARLAGALWEAGREDAYRTIADAVDGVDGLPVDSASRAQVLVVGGALSTLARRPDAIVWTQQAFEAAEAVGDERTLSDALTWLGASKICLADNMRGVDDLIRAAHIARANGWDRTYVGALLNAGSALGEVRRYELAVASLDEAVAHARERDLDRGRRYCEAWLARIQFERGRWDDVDALLTDELMTDDISPVAPVVALTVLGRLRARRGDPGAAASLERAWSLAEQTGDLQRMWPAIAGRVEVGWLRGKVSRDVVNDLRDVLERSGQTAVRYALGELGFWACKLGLHPAPLNAGAAPAYAAHVEGDLDAAASTWHELGCPYEAAWALADRGDEPALREALDCFVALGAKPMAQRVRRALHQLGVTDVPRGPRASTAGAPAGLTVREREVLELVVTGLTDREIADRLFVTTKTTGHHVSAIIRKLGVRNRVQAAAAARSWLQDGETSR